MTTFRRLALAALALSLCGCFAARYEYTRGADGSVSLVIHSNRDLPAGFVGSIGADGSLTSNVGAATGGQTDPVQLLQAVIALQPLLNPVRTIAPAQEESKQ